MAFRDNTAILKELLEKVVLTGFTLDKFFSFRNIWKKINK
jgi:hypothetical protein